MLRWLIRTLTGLYYAPVRITGPRPPTDRPVLFVANHQDSLLDPVLVGIVARRPVRFVAKAPLFEVPGFGRLLRALRMIPAQRAQDEGAQMRQNLQLIDDAAAALAAGDAIGIFPEGKSHDLPHIGEIKGGTARIALKSLTLSIVGLPPVLVPVGLNFERKESFRSALWIQTGEALDLAAFAAEHPNPREARTALTLEIETRLRAVALHLDDPDLAGVLDQLEHLTPPASLASPGPLARLQLRKRLADAMNHFRTTDRAAADEAEAGILGYAAALTESGIAPSSPIMRFRRLRLTFRLLRDALLHLLGFVPILAGVIHHIVPFSLARWLGGKFQDGLPTLALARLAFGIPLTAATYFGVWLFLRMQFLPWVAWTWIALMPFCGLLALWSARKFRRAGKALTSQAALFFQRGKLRTLRRHQQEVQAMVGNLAIRYETTHPSPPALELPWTWQRIRSLTLRWAVFGLCAAVLWTTFSHWRRSGVSLAAGGMELAKVPAPILTAMLREDEPALGGILAALPALENDCRAIAGEFASGQRNYLSQADNDALHRLMRRFVTLRDALVRTIWRYRKSTEITDPALSDRAFLTAYAAASGLGSLSLSFAEAFQSSPDAVRKLNEAEPAWDIPAGLFNTVRRSLVSPENLTAMQEAATRFSQGTFAGPPVFQKAIADAGPRLAAARGRLALESSIQPLRDARDEGKQVFYDAQTFISTWMGDTKIREPGKALINPQQLAILRSKLQPGDIMLERRNWYVSNAFLPGYWPHAALYIGSPEHLTALNLHTHPTIQPHWKACQGHDAHHHPHAVIEAISEGVVFTSLEHSAGEADSVAVLRPRLPVPVLCDCIARAFSHLGKPYDFEFDFFSSDKLVCTELVYRAFDGPITFPLRNIMGTTTLPAIQFVRKYADERGQAGAQFEFIVCLQGDPDSGTASFVDEATFLKTLDLPGNDLLIK
jgi:1-acyl-sn-glycerol-3-phosphate acyltransferase